jgi:hypothetical protein
MKKTELIQLYKHTGKGVWSPLLRKLITVEEAREIAKLFEKKAKPSRRFAYGVVRKG